MANYDPLRVGCRGGWRRYGENPIIGGEHDFCFDNYTLQMGDAYRMYFSWRTHYCIAVSNSADGFHWDGRQVVLAPRPGVAWEEDINRPTLDCRGGKFRMWYCGQTLGKFRGTDWVDNYFAASQSQDGASVIGYAESGDGLAWERRDAPVMVADQPWEKQAVMNPTVLWDEAERKYRMWYCGGGWFEPDAIGCAESPDGIHWEKSARNPAFRPDPDSLWERERVAGCQVLFVDGWYYLFYIGYEDLFKARVGMARSRNGVDGWQRHPENPILSAGLPGGWDCESIYKPFVRYDEPAGRWLMYYNARSGTTERIGIAIHDGRDLWGGSDY